MGRYYVLNSSTCEVELAVIESEWRITREGWDTPAFSESSH
jgi:hypothetical protein